MNTINHWVFEIEHPSGEREIREIPYIDEKTPLKMGRSIEADIRIRDTQVPLFVGEILWQPSAQADRSPFWIRSRHSPLLLLNGIAVAESHWPNRHALRIGDTTIRLLSRRDLIEQTPLVPSGYKPWATCSQEGLKVLHDLRQAASTRLSVFLMGETGVGKEVLAHLLHGWSPRASGPFVALNCGAVAPTLAESELFGHLKGSFTGAQAQRPGALLQAHGGTLFLDEVADLSPELQVKLLRFLENGEIRAIGSDHATRVDVRLVCATHAPLKKWVEEGRFRKDLYYRIASVTIAIPPLRSRSADIQHLAERFATHLGKTLSPSAIHRLINYPWPGNVRELQHTIERGAAQTGSFRSTIAEEDFHFLHHDTELPSEGIREDLPFLNLRQMERLLLIRSLKIHGGNRNKAARSLGISRSTIFEMMKRHGVRGPRAERVYLFRQMES